MKFDISLDFNFFVEAPDVVVRHSEQVKHVLWGNTHLNELTSDFRDMLPEVGYFKFQNVYLLGSGCLLTEDGRRIKTPYLPYTMLDSANGLKHSVGQLQQVSSRSFQTNDLKVNRKYRHAALLVQPGDGIFGHWLVDMIPKLELIRESNKNYPVIVKNRVLDGSAISDIHSIFSMVGLKNVVGFKPVQEAMFFESLIVPTVVRHGQLMHSYSETVYARLREGLDVTSPPKKVYLSRRHWSQANSERQLNNAKELEEQFSANGFDIVAPETLSFSEKIELLRNCTHLAGEKGSALHLSVFSNAIQQVTVILNPTESQVGLPLLQHSLCRNQGIICNFVCGDIDKNKPGYTVDLSSLRF